LHVKRFFEPNTTKQISFVAATPDYRIPPSFVVSREIQDRSLVSVSEHRTALAFHFVSRMGSFLRWYDLELLSPSRHPPAIKMRVGKFCASFTTSVEAEITADMRHRCTNFIQTKENLTLSLYQFEKVS
jgi:hypothetical protein